MVREESESYKEVGRGGQGSANQLPCTVFVESFDDLKNYNHEAVTTNYKLRLDNMIKQF